MSTSGIYDTPERSLDPPARKPTEMDGVEDRVYDIQRQLGDISRATENDVEDYHGVLDMLDAIKGPIREVWDTMNKKGKVK